MPYLLSLIFCLLLTSPLFAQLEWLVEPIIEFEEFYYSPDHNPNLIFVTHPTKKKGVLRTDGTYLFEPQTFTRLRYVSGSGLAYGMTEDKKTIVFNNDEKIISAQYDELNSFYRTNIVMVKKDGLFGLIDHTGKVIRKPTYKRMKRERRGLYKGTKSDGSIDRIEVGESDGLTPAKRARSREINISKIKDRIIFSAPSKKRNARYYGFTDMKGNVILPADRYYSNYNKMIYEAQLMIAIDSESQKHGVLDKDGQITVPFIYDDIANTPAGNQYLVAQKDNTYFLLDFDGKVHKTTQAEKFYPLGENPFVVAEHDKKKYILNLDLEKVVPDGLDDIWPSSKRDWTIVAIGDKKGFFSFRTGKYTAPQFVDIGKPFIYDDIGVKKDKHFALYKIHAGAYQTEAIYEYIKREGDYYVKRTKQVDSVLVDSVYQLKTTRWYTVSDSNQQVILGPSSHPISRLQGNIYIERIGTKELFLYDIKTGEKRWRADKSTSLFTNNVGRYVNGSSWFIDDVFKDQPPKYEYLSTKITDNLRIFKNDGKCGLIHKKQVVQEAIFEDIKMINEGMIKAKIDGKWGILKNPYYEKK